MTKFKVLVETWADDVSWLFALINKTSAADFFSLRRAYNRSFSDPLTLAKLKTVSFHIFNISITFYLVPLKR